MRKAAFIKGPEFGDERKIYGDNLNLRRDTVTQQLQGSLDKDKGKR